MTHNRITLRVLSGAWIEAEAGGLRITARKKVALLAYLALDRHSAPRDLLAGLIWGDTTDGKARASLRQALSELRNAHPVLKNALVIDRATVSLRRDALLVDIDQIVAEIEQGRLPPALRGGGETLNDILYGFECIGERFADWVQDSRKHCSDRILTALTTAAANAEAFYLQEAKLRHATGDRSGRCGQGAADLRVLLCQNGSRTGHGAVLRDAGPCGRNQTWQRGCLNIPNGGAEAVAGIAQPWPPYSRGFAAASRRP